MQYPTWEEVGVPESLVQLIKNFKGYPAVLDALVHSVVFSQIKKPALMYVCDNCSFSYLPIRITDEYSECRKCHNKRIRCITQSRYLKDIPNYYTFGKINNLISEIRRKYMLKFSCHEHNLLDCGWTNEEPYAQFIGGEKATGRSARSCILRAALLCPYIWQEEGERLPHIFSHFLLGVI